MALDRLMNSMLNEYLTNRLMKEEFLKRSWLMSNIEIDESWKTGTVPVPFIGAGASSIAWGALTAENDIASIQPVRGTISAYKEFTGSLIFKHADLIQHDGKIPETTFLKVMADTVEPFMEYSKEAISTQILNGAHFATVTDATNSASGVMVVDHIDRFMLGQKCDIDDGNSAQLAVYVIAINVNTNEVTFSASRGGAFVDLSAYTVAQGAKFYHPGIWNGTTSVGFLSLRQLLLSAANGGDSTIHGQSKLSFPFLQAVNIDGSAISASNILSKLFDAYSTYRQKGKGGNPNKIVMSFKHWGSVLKLLESTKGAYKVVVESKGETLQYGWSEVMIADVANGKSPLTIVGVQEMPDDLIFGLDMKTMKFICNGFLKKIKTPDGLNFHTLRATTGYSFITDVLLQGETMLLKPAGNFVIHSIPNY